MSKYDALWSNVAGRTSDSVAMTFAEIEQVLGFPIDHSFLNFKKELTARGWEVGKISLKSETVEFKRCAGRESDFADNEILFFLTKDRTV